MLLPSVFGEDLFDETFPFAGMTDRHGHDKLFGNRAGRLMKTDVREGEKSWELDVELPGFRKENISATLKDGYLTISLDSSELQYMFSIYGDLEVGDDVVLVCNRNGSSYTAVDALEY